ncbi:sigma-54-dependent Fis family transcriptional regulator [Pontibacter sp. JAM-7]|uniref:sigma-54-dependent Fis family transcriptional regulator n=1 Tax=Pontibacter sp. JAM-7 TaxID=3366581 RepID=UPI003AF83851
MTYKKDHLLAGSAKSDSDVTCKDSDGEVNNYIQNSWDRCRDRYKIDPNSDIELVNLSDSEVRQKREPLEKLLADSAGVFDKIRAVSKNSGYTVLLTNTEGLVVKSFCDSGVSHELESRGLRQGSLWAESLIGTNGLGTCLTEAVPVTVYAEEHYGSALQNFSCSAAPLIDPAGNPFGALDVSTFATGNRLGQALALNLVCETADEIETLIFREAYENQRIISMSTSTMLAPTTALVAVNECDTIIAATTPLLLAMGCSDRYQLVGKKFCDTFELTFEQLESTVIVEHSIRIGNFRKKFFATLIPPVNKTAKISKAHMLKLDVAKKHTKTADPECCPLQAAAGKDSGLLRQAARCARIVDKGISILLEGQTGTGKEVWARALHNSSSRRDKPFVTLNCAAIPESLIESELFGYSAGTFTGGLKSGKVGKIQASNGGTLFLDEIGDMPLELQARLLRVLAEKEIIPLGEVNPLKINLNVICATHRDLKEFVGQGDFREDLYYRISGFRIHLPSLSQREDKPHIINKVLTELCREESDADNVFLANDAMAQLSQYSWPGNIRQLKNVLQFALCMREEDMIRLVDLPEEVFAEERLAPVTETPHDDAVSNYPPSRLVSISHQDSAGLSEKEELEQVLEQHRWVVTRAAKALGVSRSTLHRKIKKHGLLVEGQEPEAVNE